jgi:ParB-like chromosome segregation protein Spo0J
MVRVHPAASLLPRMPAAEFDALVEDIRVNGQRMPVLLAGGLIVDGRHRWEACERIGIECMTESIDIDDAAALVRSLNVHRRHLTESQRAIVAAGLATLSEGRPSETASIEAVSQADAAELLNVSRSAVQRATKVRDEGAPELIAAVTSGEVSVSAAAEVATLPPAEQTEVVAKGEKAIISAAKDILAKRATERLVKRAMASAPDDDVPAGETPVVIPQTPPATALWAARRLLDAIEELAAIEFSAEALREALPAYQHAQVTNNIAAALRLLEEVQQTWLTSDSAQ